MALPSTFSWTQCRTSIASPRCSFQSDTKKKRGESVIQEIVLRDRTAAPAVVTDPMVKVTLPTTPPTPPERELGARRTGFRVQDLVSAVLSAAESFIPLIEPGEHSLRTNPRLQLDGNFAPVEESPPRRVLAITGRIPKCLNGAYIRNGGNPQFAPTAGFHFFDGDGMLHVVRIKDGEATHCCRFTKTNRFLCEKRAGRPVFPKALGELHGWGGVARLAIFALRIMAGVADMSKGMGAANAGVEFFNGMVLAMSEDDMPYAVRVTEDGDLETLGRYNFEGALKTAMTAHPKIDTQTGEMSAFSYDVLKQPYLTYFRVSPSGVKGVDVPITLPESNLMHDFGITENYAIFPEGQIVFRLQELFQGKSPILCDEKKVSRFGVLPRTARSEAHLRWFDLPDATSFHYVNAWEEGDEIVLVGSTMSPIDSVFDQPSDLEIRICLFRLNLRTGQASKHQLADANLDAGRCNGLYAGGKTRYVYTVISGPWPRYSGIAKMNLENGKLVGWWKCPRGGFVSEPCFIPQNEEGEDNGYVVTHYHDETMGISELLVMDAQSPTLDIVANIRMPSRVPYGFHGLFLTEAQLASQRMALPSASHSSWRSKMINHYRDLFMHSR